MAAPVGNQNAAKGKKWREAIMRALARKSGSVEQGLDTAADRLVKLMHEGELNDVKWAIEHAADRIDGKPAVTVAGDDENPLVIREIVIRAIDATRDRPPEEG